MNSVNHTVKHQYQTTSTNCSPTALSMLLSHYDDDVSAAAIAQSVPQLKDESGEESGTINQQLATWCVERGYTVNMLTFDCQVIDQAWSNLSKEAVLGGLHDALNTRNVPSMGELWSQRYIQSYIDYLKAGGELNIQSAVTSKTLYELLATGPILAAVSFCTLHSAGLDDGKAYTHSIVIHGQDAAGNFLIADPYKEPGHHTVKPDRLIAAISTAQMECDNLLFVIRK